MNAEELAGLGHIVEEIEPLDGLKVRYHSLSISEEEEINKAMAAAPQDILARTNALQVETLVQAIESIGGKTFHNQDDLRKYLKRLQRHVLTALWSAWNDNFDQPSFKSVEDLKKNSERPQEDSSGNTAEPSESDHPSLETSQPVK